MKSLLWSVPLGFLIGCQPTTPGFENDTFLSPSSGVGVKRQLLGPPGDGPNGAHIIFLNYDGQQVQPPRNGWDNPDTGDSWIARSSVFVDAFNANPYKGQFTADQAKNAITNYFKGFYAPFNVQVVTTRPAAGTRYTMCIIGDDATTVLGGGAGAAAGVAPLDCDNNNEEEITYAFSAGLAPNQTGLSLTESLKAIAVTAAQETAHSYGLSHTNSSQDIMYPQLDLDQNGFVDQSLGLINNPNGACHGATKQNSKQLLGSIVGFSNGMMPIGDAPTVKWVAPTANQTVPMQFTLIVDAQSANSTITKVDVSSGPQTLFSWTTPPFRENVMAPGEGTYQITATAFDANGNFQTSSVTFTASKNAPAQQLPPCQSNNECVSGEVCDQGKCVVGGSTTGSTGSTTGSTGSTTGSTGSTTSGTGGTSGGIVTGIPTGGDCTEDAQCQSAICDEREGHNFCTAVCDEANANSCPAGLTCVSDSGAFLCQRPSSSGCSAAPGAPVPGAFGFLMLLALSGLRLARRRA
jgi:hypothetical protein